jgi:predicted PurR-regulated permease PerM
MENMHSWFTSPSRRNRAILVGILLTIAVTIVMVAWAALVPFLVGAVLAYLLLPIVDFLDRRSPRLLRNWGWSRPLAIVLVYVGGIGLFAGVLAYFVPAVGSQAESFVIAVPSYFQYAQGQLLKLVESIPPDIQTVVKENLAKIDLANAVGTLLNAVQKGLVVTISTVTQTISFILGIVIIPFWLFLVLKDAAKARQAFYDLIPEQAREDVLCIVTIIDDLLSAYVRGRLLLCLLVGVMATIVLLILGVDLALLLGTFAGIFEVIPVVGPYLGAIPAVLIALLNRPMTALWVALAFAAIQQIENIFLAPRISGNAVRFHPAVVMIIVVIASQVAGILGLMLGVPVAAVLRDIFRYLYLRTTERGATPQEALRHLHTRSP